MLLSTAGAFSPMMYLREADIRERIIRITNSKPAKGEDIIVFSKAEINQLYRERKGMRSKL